jgi:hypothetical protein
MRLRIGQISAMLWYLFLWFCLYLSSSVVLNISSHPRIQTLYSLIWISILYVGLWRIGRHYERSLVELVLGLREAERQPARLMTAFGIFLAWFATGVLLVEFGPDAFERWMAAFAGITVIFLIVITWLELRWLRVVPREALTPCQVHTANK